MMHFRLLGVFACVALAIAAASAFAHGDGDKVTKNFEQAIPNIPGKSVIGFVVDPMRRAGHRSRIRTQSRPSSTPTLFPEASNRRSTTALRGSTRRASWSEPPGASHLRQPQCEQDRASKAARGLRRGYR